MPFLPLFLQALSTAAVVAGTVQSVKAGRESVRLQKQKTATETRRSRRQAIRQAQLQQSQARAVAAGAGALGGSALAGGQSALTSQLGTQLGYSTQLSGISQGITEASGRAAEGADLASLGFSGLNMFGLPFTGN